MAIIVNARSVFKMNEQDLYYSTQFTWYGKATKYNISKHTLRNIWRAVMIALPFVTPLAAFAHKVFKKDVCYIRRYEKWTEQFIVISE